MNNRVRILWVTLLTSIYCLAVNMVTYPHISSDYGNHHTTEQEQYLTTVSSSLFSHIAPVEKSVNSFNVFSGLDFKSQADKLWSITQATGQLLEAEFSQYGRLSVNFPIHFRKSDLIFPFHYFW